MCSSFLFADNKCFARKGSALFASVLKYLAPCSKLIVCCETYKCVDESSSTWLKENESKVLDYELVDLKSIDVLNTEIGMRMNGSVRLLSDSMGSFNRRYYNI